MDKLSPENINNKALYLEYLRYVNDKIIALVNKIISGDKNDIIVLLSDLGYRYANDGDLSFSNLLAIYDKQHNIQNLEALNSNGNVFRLIFNSLFHTRFNLLPNQIFK